MAERTELSPEERRAKRDARRAKQRETNVVRAEKMHAARLANTAQTVAVPVTIDKELPFGRRWFVGCSGWFYWHWRGDFYPTTISTNQWFKHYASRFQTVELNAPFYAWPTVGTVRSWRKQIGRKQFLYTVKVSELITHVRQFLRTKQLVADFSYIATILGPHMGCFLFQLPPSYRYTAARLKRIVEQLNPAVRNVVEFRHRSWWNEKVFAAFRTKGIIFCSCSGPRLPDELVKTADDVYVRLHGIKQWYRHDYTDAELAVWVDRIRSSGAKRAWIYFNNDRDGHAIRNAKEMLRQLKRS